MNHPRDPHQDIGTILRAAREQAGLSLRQIADTTKLSVHVLSALEQNRISQLPGGIYRRAIVRSFAREVGLDPEQTLRRFLAIYPDDVPTAVIARTQTAPGSSRRVLHSLASLLGAVIPIAAGIFYFTSTTGSSSPKPHASVAARRAPPARPVPRSSDIQAARAIAPERSGRTVSMTLSVSSGTRLQVVADGQEILARRLEAGEEVRLDFGTDAVLLGDDAGAVHVSFDGRAARSLGDAGSPLNVRFRRDSYQGWLREP